MKRSDLVMLLACLIALLSTVVGMSILSKKHSHLEAYLAGDRQSLEQAKEEVRKILALASERERILEGLRPAGVATFLDTTAQEHSVSIAKIDPSPPVEEGDVLKHAITLRLRGTELKRLTEFLYAVSTQKPQLRVSAIRIYRQRKSPQNWEGSIEISFVEPGE